MGALFSSLAALFTSHREYKLIIVGLDNAGTVSYTHLRAHETLR